MLNKYKFFILTIIFAFCSIIYELLLANTLSYITGEQSLYQAITIGVYILGLGIGSYLTDKVDIDNSEKVFRYVELGLTFFGLFAITYIFALSVFYSYYDFFLQLKETEKSFELLSKIKFIYVVLGQILTITIGILSGFEIPLLIRISKKEENTIFFFNYFGTLLGSIIFSYILMAHFSLNGIAYITATLNFLGFLLLLKRRIMQIIYCIAFSILVIYTFPMLNKIEKFYYKSYYSFKQVPNHYSFNEIFSFIKDKKDIQRIYSPYQKIDIVEGLQYNNAGIEENIFTLYMDTNFQFASNTEHFYHQGFAHVPMILNKSVPKRVLILGAGDGLLLRELLKHPEIDHIDQVELDPVMVDLASNNQNIKEMNQNSMKSKKLNLMIGDGFHYVRTTHNKYDAIYIDFPYPKSHDISRLYSKEFYQFVRRILNRDGFVALDAPMTLKTSGGYNNKLKQNSILMSTLQSAGFDYMLPYLIDEESFIFISKTEEIDKNVILRNKIFREDVQKHVDKLFNNKFDYEIHKKYINSVFSPKF